jgi:uncharacterized membrane protein YphA (DoxX/SURF4 family)
MRGFSTSFPRGSAGVGLLLLRASVALQLLIESGCNGPAPWWLAIADLLLILALTAGLLTPVASLLAVTYQASCLLHADWLHAAGLLIAVVTAIALVLLGAGAYSLDARLFGRRRLIFPAAPTDSD